MVGIHGEIMENERENLHQLTEARDEVFALVLHNFSMDSHHSFSIMGNIVFLTYMHNYIPQIETDKKSGPSKGKKYDFAMKFFRFAWPWWLSSPYLFELYLCSTMCVGILRRKHLKRCSFRRERWPRRNEGAKVGFEKEGTARY